jgi:stage III sporulation protein SpoIIIAA
MYISESTETTEFTRCLANGTKVPYTRKKTWYNFTCDNCGCSFKRPKNGKDTLSRSLHYCSECPYHQLAQKRTSLIRKKKSEIRGRKFDRGYPEICVGDNYPYRKSRWIREHIYVIEKHIKKRIPEGMVVHHIDGSKTNNLIDNLLLCTVEQHNQCHAKIERLVFELYDQGLVGFDREKMEYYYKK